MQKANMPTARLGLATAVVNGRIYAIGGYTASGSARLSIVEEYNPATDTWTAKSPVLTARAWLYASVVDGKIYAIGGHTGAGEPGLPIVEIYDPATDTWTREAYMPTGRYYHSADVVDGKIYLVAGRLNEPQILLSVDAYDLLTDTWTSKAGKMPTARVLLGISVVDGKNYAIGGATGPNASVAAVEEYDPVTDTWTRKSNMPTARMILSASTVNGRIYAIGGSEMPGPPHPGVRTVEEYEPNPLVVDFNGDGIVDCADMCMMLDHWHTDEPLYDIGPTPFGDGIVDVQDLIVLAEHLFEDYRLIAHWALDETQGDIAQDSAGVNNGILNGNALWQPTGGQVDGALAFDGTDDYVSTDFVLNPAEAPFSVFAWIKGGAPGQVILSQISGANWLLADPAEGKLITDLKSPGRSGNPLLSQTVITDGNWHRIGLTWDGSNRILYVDDLEVARDTQAQLGGSAEGLYIGAGKNLDAASFFSGLIDDVRIYDRAVTP